MPKPRKSGKYLNLYMDARLYDEFAAFCENIGQSKTLATERAIALYMKTYKSPFEAVPDEKSQVSKKCHEEGGK